ncbi:MAG TPA: DUF4249 family protein [Pricia antarctica]|uniref:DUF4249 family protein n=2 Tax=root TaxID=1 RepID=A0A831VPY7_9FLAO|nr:DUF4249 family protein [Pricia antarctica]
MKRYILLSAVLFILCSCEDVVEVDAPSEPARLSIDALIRIDDSLPITHVVITAGLTSSFFGDVSTAELDSIIIRNNDFVPTLSTDENFLILNETSPGRYEGDKETSFFTNGGLELYIGYGDSQFLASTRYAPAVPIDKLEQGEGQLFTGDETEVLVAFTDNANRDDFYLFDFDFNEYLVTEDEFYQGQTFEFSYFYDEDVKPGREINVSLLGVNEAFYNYMNQLIVQAGGDQGPFQTPSATVRGNIVNVTNNTNSGSVDVDDVRNNFALGYFAVCQTFDKSIVIQ